MAKALVIWQVIPEDVKYYLMENVSEQEVRQFELCNGQVMNVENAPAVDAALGRLYSATHEGSFFKEITSIEVFNCKPDYLCVTGILL